MSCSTILKSRRFGAANKSTDGEVANALVCKISIRGFNSRSVLQIFLMSFTDEIQQGPAKWQALAVLRYKNLPKTLPQVVINFIFRPTGGPSEALKRCVAPAPRVAGPSGRTVTGPSGRSVIRQLPRAAKCFRLCLSKTKSSRIAHVGQDSGALK